MSRYHQGRKRNRNPSPPPFSQRQVVEEKPRKVRQVTSAADHAELEKHYSFLPSDSTETYQDRMVKHYHSHLYKEYVLADLTRPGQVGLRWRTAEEVKRGKGNATCGNKHCPSYAPSQVQNTDSLREYYTQQSETNEQEQLLLEKVSYGLGLHDYEVPFTYQEHGDSKTELVKLRLCLRCAPLLFRKKDSLNSSLEARRARETFDRGGEEEVDSAREGDRKREYSSDASLSSTASQDKRRHRRKKRGRRRSKR